MADNLIQKKGESTWYVRLAVPADVQSALGCKVLIQSLRTSNRAEAKERRLSILGDWKARIAQARDNRKVRGDTWKEPVANTAHGFANVIRQLKTELVLGEDGEPSTTFDPADIQALHQAVFDDSPEGRARRQKADQVYAMTGIEGELANIEFAREMVLQLMAKAFAVTQGLSPQEEEEAAGILNNPNAYAPKTPFTAARMKAYREFRESRAGAPKHIDQQVGKMERLSKFLKDNSLPLDFDSVDLWLKSLDRAPKTLTQYLMAGTAFWKWAIRYDTGWREDFKNQPNPFVGHDLPKGGGKETAGAKREAYTTIEIERLHKGAMDAGNHPLADLILMGAYTGARIEELCQLRVEHVIEPDGVKSLKIVVSKTKAGERIVPIHPALLSTVDRLIKDSTDGFLIPVTTENQYNKRSHAISKAFGLLRTRLGFGPLYVFHGMRNTVITELVRADVADHLIKELVGHEHGSITHDVYSRGASMAQKLAAISKLPSLRYCN